tara:strand:- start:745 stop:1287 length:543 start_codon:yes stop_codon:yes gene_type:complete
MGFLTRILPSGIMFDDVDIPSSTPVDNTQTLVTINTVEKTYFLIDKIDIHYVNINDKENINVKVSLSVYNSYEERLNRENLLMTLHFYIQDFVDKKSSENLWTKCYVKIKELLLNQNTESLKEALTIREREVNPPTYTDTLMTDPITGEESIVPIPNDPIIIDTIPPEYEYLLEIDDHFN